MSQRLTASIQGLGALAFCVWFLGLPLAAQDSNDSSQPASPKTVQTTDQEEIVVSALRLDQDPQLIPGTVLVLDKDKIAASGKTSLPEILESLADIEIHNYGGTGSTKSLSIRGSASGQVLVLLDGMPLNSARDGSVDWESIPLASIERIEILPGTGGGMYGSSALGGIINILRRNPKGLALSLQVNNTSYLPWDGVQVTETGTEEVAADASSLVDTQQIRLWAGYGFEGGHLSLGGGFTRAANQWFWYDDDLASQRLRLHNGYLGGNFDLDGSLDLPGLDLGLQVRGDVSSYESPGSSTWVSTDALQANETVSAGLNLGLPGLLGEGNGMKFRVSYGYDHLSYEDPDPLFPQDSDHEEQSLRINLDQTLVLTKELRLVFGGDYSYIQVNSSNYAEAATRNAGGVFVYLPLSLDGLELGASGRLDLQDVLDPALSADIGAVILLGESADIDLKLATAYKAPSLNDLYWSDSWSSGNMSLVPERAWSAELGASYAEKGFKIHGYGFVRWVEDQIVWLSDPMTWVYSPVNLGQSLVPGAGLDASLGIAGILDVTLAYTWQYPVVLEDSSGAVHDVAEGLRIPYTPDHQFKVGVNFHSGPVSANLGFSVVSAEYIDAANTQDTMLPVRTILDLGAHLDLGSGFTVNLELDNLLGQTYSTVANYPMPPFSITLGLGLKI